MKTLDVQLTISKRESNDEKYINVNLRDATSGINFAEVKVSLEDFMEALTGLGYVHCKAEVRGLEHLGKKKERERASVVISDDEYAIVTDQIKNYEAIKVALGNWLKANHSKEGWFVDTYLGSQGSIGHTNSGGRALNFAYYRYVDATE